ncbi:MAG: translocation/assembly module TamB domain-containing protein, partial [Terracidiphilus sp.]
MDATRARFALADGELRIASMRGDILGGQLNVSSGTISLTGKSASQLSAKLTNISVAELSKALPSHRSGRLSLVGRADVNARVSWLSQFRDFAIDSRAKISSPPNRTVTRDQIPLNGTIQMAYSRRLNKASFGNSQINIGKTAISMTGVLSEHSDLMVTLISGDLHQFSALAGTVEEAFSSSASGTFRMPNITGSGRFDGRVHGSPRAPQINGQLTARDLAVESTQWSSIQANLRLSPSHASISNGLFVSKSLGSVQLTASIGLRHWSMAPSSRISAHLAATNLPVSKIETVARVSYPVDGTASADITVAGTKESPSGHGWIHIANATAWKQSVKLVTVNFHGDSGSLEADLAAESPAGPIAGTVVYDSLSKQYQLHVNTSGLKLSDLEMVQARHLPLHGTLIANGSGSGSIANPEFSLSMKMPQLGFRGESVSNIRSQVNLENRQLKFAANAALYQGTLQTQGNVALAGQYQASATLDIRALSVGLVAARYIRQGGPTPQGKTDLHVVAQGPLKDPSRFTIRAEIPTMSLTYQTVTLTMVRPLIAEYRDGAVTLQKSEIKGTGIDFSFQGEVPLNRSKPFDFAANGNLDLNLLPAMTSTFQSSGQVKVNVTARGTLDQPNMQGSLQLQNASLTSASMPVDLTGVTGDIRVSGRRMEIIKLNGNVNGGLMTAQGSVDLGTTPAFDLAVAAQSVTIDYPAGVRARLDGNLRLNGATSGSALTGRVLIDYLGFTQQMDIASLASQFSSGGGVSTPSNFEKNMKLNIALQSSSTLALASSELSVQGAANLDVVGTLANPVVLGRATLTNGELFFLGKRYEVKSGTIEFVNPTQTMATVDLYASTTVNQYNISLHFAGPVDQMKT